MSINRVNFTSSADFINKMHNYQKQDYSFAPKNPDSEIKTAVQDSKPKKKSNLKEWVFSMVCLTGVVWLACTGRLSKMLKNISKWIEKHSYDSYVDLSETVPTNRLTQASNIETISAEVVDTRYLRPDSKLRMRPPVEDVEFVEIK